MKSESYLALSDSYLELSKMADDVTRGKRMVEKIVIFVFFAKKKKFL